MVKILLCKIFGIGKHRNNMNNKSMTTTVLIDLFILSSHEYITIRTRNGLFRLCRMILVCFLYEGFLLNLRAIAMKDLC